MHSLSPLPWIISFLLVAGTIGCGDDDSGLNQQNQQNQNTNQPVCGNGVLEIGEVCDEGSQNSDSVPDACRTDCREAYCGDGVTDTGEACDEAGANSDLIPGACRRSCTQFSCGDMVVDPGEVCDDGNTTNADGCSASCLVEAHFLCQGSPSDCVCLPYRSGALCRTCVVHVDGARAGQPGDGIAWDTAFGELQPGLDTAHQAGVGCEVWVTGETYHIYRDSVLNTVQLRDGVALYGGFVGTETERDQRDWLANETQLSARNASQTHGVVHVVTALDTQDATVDGFIIANGWAHGLLAEDRMGGGLYLRGSNLAIVNCTVRNNNCADRGGGLFAYGSSVEIQSCLFENNDSSVGGGGVALALASASVRDSVFDGNRALLNTSPGGQGGAIYGQSGELQVERCIFTSNYAADRGGGLYLWYTNSTIVNTLLVDNEGDEGGAIYNNSSVIDLLHATVVWNDAFVGSALNCNSGSTTNFTSSIIWYNGSNTFGAVGTVFSTNSNSDVILSGTDNISLAPQFVGLGDYHLLAASPCVDAAYGADAPTTDLEGAPRHDVITVIDAFDCSGQPNCISYADIGAYEYQP